MITGFRIALMAVAANNNRIWADSTEEEAHSLYGTRYKAFDTNDTKAKQPNRAEPA